MTTNQNKNASEIEELFKQEKFEEVAELFINNSLSARELIILYKKKKSPLLYQKYWQSNLPLLYLDDVIESEIKVLWLSSYFKSDDFCNDRINERILQLNPKEFIRFLKFTRAFNKPKFWSSLNGLKDKSSDLKNVLKELLIIREKLDKLQNETQDDNMLLLQYPLFEIIIAFSLNYQSFKKQGDILGNKAFQTEIEVSLIDELNRVINLFFSHNKQMRTIPIKTNTELQTYFNNRNKDPFIPKLFRLIERMIERKYLQGGIDLYCCGYSDFVSPDVLPYYLKTNQSHVEFVLNNKKSGPEEFYIHEMAINKDPEILMRKRISGEDEIKYFKYYGIPTKIKLDNKLIDLSKVFKLLKHISVYKAPSELSNQVPEQFKKVFGGNELVSLFDYNQFIQNISSFFNWDKVECENIMEFLSTNLDADSNDKNWLANPFIISQGKILWIGMFLRDRRWENIVLNKIKSEKHLARNVQAISKNLETSIINLFKNAGFKAFNISNFKTSSGENGEIDVLAYKNGCLIIAEVKSGGRSDDFSHARFSEIIKFEGDAAEQLHKIERYIKEDWENIKKSNGIETPKPIDKIAVYPMIITDYFEGELKLYKGKYYKTSLLELDVIINNTKEKLLKDYYLLQIVSNVNNKNFNKDGSKIDYDLLGNKGTLSVETLISKIETNAVWKEIEKIWRVEPAEYNLV